MAIIPAMLTDEYNKKSLRPDFGFPYKFFNIQN